MKNLPEKIYAYIPEDDIVGTASTKKGVPHQYVDIEYIRKDVFIEKAAKWLDDNIWAYIEIMHPTVDSYTRINRERLIWDFKKVMRK